MEGLCRGIILMYRVLECSFRCCPVGRRLDPEDFQFCQQITRPSTTSIRNVSQWDLRSWSITCMQNTMQQAARTRARRGRRETDFFANYEVLQIITKPCSY